MNNLRQRTIRLLIVFVATFVAGAYFSASAQKVGIKTDIVSDATLNPNAGIEIGLAPKWTLDVSGQFNLWTLSQGRKWKHWLVQPEARYWFCQAFAGHFVGAHVLGGQYNIGKLDMPFKFLGTDFRKLKDYRFQGWMAGAGIAYGYAWVLDRHWNLEAEIGLGWVYTRYDKFECADCGQRVETNKPHNYFGPTKVAINFVYTF